MGAMEELLSAKQLGSDEKQVHDSVKNYYGEVSGARLRLRCRKGRGRCRPCASRFPCLTRLSCTAPAAGPSKD
jgi:hypothetical protein